MHRVKIMKVSVSFLGLQRKLTRIDRIQVPLTKKIRVVADLLSHIKNVYPDLAIKKEMVLVTVNNHASSLDQRLRANDEVSFIPHIGGG
jgi:molybdopterin converting factor small subunit